MAALELSARNQKELRKLVLSIKANPQDLNLLLAICDDANLQDRLISEYEQTLKASGFRTFKTRIKRKQPSLKESLAELVEQHSVLGVAEPAVVTVLDASYLLGVRLSEEKSEQEKFFFSLQWTREALRQFKFPVVLWLSDTVATRLGRQAPDFWSWRRGVFEFEAATKTVSQGALLPSAQSSAQAIEKEAEQSASLSIGDLQQQIADLKETSPESSLLISAYNDLGNAYAGMYAYGEALNWYQQGLELAERKNNLQGQARSLMNLGDSLWRSGRSRESVGYYQRALETYREIEDRQGEASTLGNLGIAYRSLCEYQRAVDFHQQSIEIKREIGDRQGEATSLGNLGLAYDSLGEYQRAIDFYQQTLEIAQEIGDHRGEAYALGNLGLAYDSLGEHQRAIDFHQQSIEIKREIGDRQGEANSLGSLGIAYDSLGEYRRAIDFQQQYLEIAREIGDRRGEANALGNLGIAYYSLGEYQQAIDFYQQTIEIAREIGDRRGEANAYFNQANALSRIDEKWSAQSSYEAAKALYESLELPQEVENCDKAIRELGQRIVAIPKQAPEIIPSKSRRTRKRRVPLFLCFLAAIFLTVLIFWLFQ